MAEVSTAQQWDRYKKYLCECPSIGLSLDVSRMHFADGFFAAMTPAMTAAFAAMDKLEGGAIANADEKRMVGHYWLRDVTRAPTPEIRKEITDTVAAIKKFASDIHSGRIKTQGGHVFSEVLVIGIGGSALGPQFVADALTTIHDKMNVHFFDNTDPDGMDRVLARLEGELGGTLAIVISKSGGTKETRNGMLAAQAAYAAEGLDFGRHAVAVTGDGSELDAVAKKGAWLARFPMWDWVGGRTSEVSAVGLLPAAIQGFDIDAILKGAADTDHITRMYAQEKNPAALLALMWYYASSGKVDGHVKDMVVLPYKDRLLLFSKYLQQLIMESLGKELDRAGGKAFQGINVFGNKGSTDQHAYVQQLREGINNFFVTFVEVLKDRSNVSPAPAETSVAAMMVEPDTTSGDYLHGFFQGTRTALAGNGRESITLTVDEVSPRTIGVLIALYERAVGLYAELVNINAYHQPGVEAGKKAATAVISLQKKILTHLRTGAKGTAEQIAAALNVPDQVETVHLTLRHMAANPEHAVTATGDEVVAKAYSAS